MKRHIIPCILALTLLLTACGGGQNADVAAQEAGKDHYYQILDADGRELYTVTDDTAVAELDARINEVGGENAAHGGAEGDPLYTYVYWQETTLHAGEVKSYIQLCLAISHQALVQQRAMRTRTHSENEKYTFRTWLLRLGLIGDEFKTARQHLLKNLDGNIAWKDPAQAIRQRERQIQQRLEQAQSSAALSDTVQEVHQQQEEAPAFSMEEQC